jgi:outer membrane murein-binding lipoprotein Lpp
MPNHDEWRVRVDQDRQTFVAIGIRLEAKMNQIADDARATRRHVTAQTYVGARAPVPLVLSVISFVSVLVMASVMIAGCQ